MTIENKGKVLASGRFKILGEGEKFTGKVNFSEDEAERQRQRRATSAMSVVLHVERKLERAVDSTAGTRARVAAGLRERVAERVVAGVARRAAARDQPVAAPCRRRP